MSVAPEDLKRLAEPFPAEDVEWRLQSAGEKNGKVWAICLAYITNRAIMERLDEVCGPANWRNEFKEGPGGGVLCGISIRIGGEWVTKWDGAENTDIEKVKGGLSNAMKRAAVQWGIGRYLYQLEEGFAKVSEDGAHRGATKDKKPFKWDPPALPEWALPGGTGKPGASAPIPAPKSTPKATRSTKAAAKSNAEMDALIAELLGYVDDQSNDLTREERQQMVTWAAKERTADEIRHAIARMEALLSERAKKPAA